MKKVAFSLAAAVVLMLTGCGGGGSASSGGTTSGGTTSSGTTSGGTTSSGATTDGGSIDDQYVSTYNGPTAEGISGLSKFPAVPAIPE
jgi:hypothetical protein